MGDLNVRSAGAVDGVLSAVESAVLDGLLRRVGVVGVLVEMIGYCERGAEAARGERDEAGAMDMEGVGTTLDRCRDELQRSAESGSDGRWSDLRRASLADTRRRYEVACWEAVGGADGAEWAVHVAWCFAAGWSPLVCVGYWSRGGKRGSAV